VFSDDGRHHAYLARIRDEMRVVADGKISALEAVVAGTLVHAAEGPHWACLAADEETSRLYIAIDGTNTRPLDVEELAAALTRSRNLEARLAMARNTEILRRWVAAELALSSGRSISE
jgi:hypothetical protein